MHFEFLYTIIMTEQSAESYVSLYGNDKAISILQNVKKVMVVLKKHTYCRKNINFFFFFLKVNNHLKKTFQLKK